MKKKVRRVVLGVGYPWYSKDNKRKSEDGYPGAGYQNIMLTEKRDGWGDGADLSNQIIGGWVKVRLVAEIL